MTRAQKGKKILWRKSRKFPTMISTLKVIQVNKIIQFHTGKSKIRRPPKRRLCDFFQACAHAELPDFPTFRQPCSYQKLTLVVH